MDELAIDLFAQNSDRSLTARRTSQTDSSLYDENSYGFPYGNIILNLFNNAQAAPVGLTPIFNIFRQCKICHHLLIC